MQAKDRQFEGACARLYIEFLEKFPNDDPHDLVSRALAMLLKRQTEFPGEAGSWAGGIVYAVRSCGCGVPDVMNTDLEKAFNTKMAIIHKRAGRMRLIYLLTYDQVIEGPFGLFRNIQQTLVYRRDDVLGRLLGHTLASR